MDHDGLNAVWQVDTSLRHAQTRLKFRRGLDGENITNLAICPRCGARVLDISENSPHVAISRKDNKTYVCSPCGQDEALIAFLFSQYASIKERTKNVD